MTERLEIRLAGSGGQGLILAGMILAEAVGIHGGKFVTQTQSYGPEARGGASKSEVVVSDQEIDYPQAMKPDILLSMNQAACDAYIFDIKAGGTLIVDSSLVHHLPTTRAIGLPFTKIAREEIGREMMGNIGALGALSQLPGIVTLENLEKALLARVPKGTEDQNRQALAAGVAAARNFMKKKTQPKT